VQEEEAEGPERRGHQEEVQEEEEEALSWPGSKLSRP
jgi:hypothetical protein